MKASPITTVREALRDRCGIGPSSYRDGHFVSYKRGCKGDDLVTVNRRALRILFEGLVAAEQYRSAPLVDLAVKLASEVGDDRYADEIKRVVSAQVDLDRALCALEVAA